MISSSLTRASQQAIRIQIATAAFMHECDGFLSMVQHLPQPSDDELELERDMEYFVEPEEALGPKDTSGQALRRVQNRTGWPWAYQISFKRRLLVVVGRHETGLNRGHMLTTHKSTADPADVNMDVRRTEALLKMGALQCAIFNSANFSSIATDANGVIQIFNVGAERMLGYTAAEVIDRITPADISDRQELIARATALSLEFATPIALGFEALVFKASRGIEDIYELTYCRKDGSRFPAVVSVTALRDAQDAIIGYLLIGTDNTARKQVEEERKRLEHERDQILVDLRRALDEVTTLRGLIPICAWCKKVRDDHGYWQQLEEFLCERTQATFTHGICADCARNADVS